MLMEDKRKSHYTYVKRFGVLMHGQNNDNNKKHFCE